MSAIQDSRSDLYAAVAALPEVSGVNVSVAWVPQFYRESMTTLGVVIAPESTSCEQRSRGCKSNRVIFSIAIIQPLEKGQEEIQLLQNVTIADSICSLLGTRLGGTTDATVTKAEHVSIVAERHYREFNLASTFLALTLEF